MEETSSPLPKDPRARRIEVATLVARPLLGLLALGALVALLGRTFRGELTALSHWVVDTFGYAGIAAGTVIADGLQFPIGPQAYMLATIAAGWPAPPVLLVVSLSSIAGGHLGMFIARALSRTRFVRRMTERGPLPALIEKHGTWAFTLAGILPVPFSILCYTCGVFRCRYQTFAVVCLIRIPKLMVFYAIIRAGWGS